MASGAEYTFDPHDLLNLTDVPGTSCDRGEASQLSWLLIDIALVFVLLCGVSISLLLCYWDSWYSHTIASYFLMVDRDNSGCVNQDELYTGVLQLYAAVPMKVYPPKRKTVTKIVAYLEDLGLVQHSSNLNVDEFSLVMATLSAQCLGRALITVVFYLACPLMAAGLWTLVVDYVRK